MEDNVFDLSGFTPYTESHNRCHAGHIDVTYLRLAIERTKGKTRASLYLSRYITAVAMEKFGKTVNVHVDMKNRLFAITPGDSLSLSIGGKTTNRRATISIGGLYATCVDIFGKHRRVYFASSVYDNCILLTPNGLVD